MYKLCFFVPPSHLDEVKQVLFDAGVGRIGDYDQCCWQVLGSGQFRGLVESDPFLGQQGRVEQVEEYKVEMVCEDSLIQDAVRILKKTHPYEEPAFDVFRLSDFT